MKKKSIYFLLLFLILVCPTFASPQFKFTLNRITYEPLHSPLLVNKSLFISLDDLLAMTYSDYTQDENGNYNLSIQNTTLTFVAESKNIKVNGKLIIVKTAPTMANKMLYVPITFLDLANYPYELSSNQTQLSLTSILPYSSSTDTYSTHKHFPTKFKDLNEVFSSLLNEDTTTTLIKEALKSNKYLSSISSSYKEQLLVGIKEQLTSLPEVEVSFRPLDLLRETPTSKALTSYPLKLNKEDLGISLEFNDKKISYTSLWPTYNPSTYTTDIDVDKTLDVMIMRALYEYYRDTYDLKDDISFSPITTVQMGRSDAITYTVYSDHLVDKTHTYKVVIYKKIISKKIIYIIDLIAVN